MSDQSSISQPVSSKRLSNFRDFFLAACSVALLSCVSVACMIAGFIWFLGRNPENLAVTYEMPVQATVDETFDLTLRITNTGSSDLFVSDIDLKMMFGSTILDGVLVLDTEPDLERDFSVPGIKTFRLNSTLPPGESKTVIFHLKAFEPGNFGGPVAVYVGMLSSIVNPSITVTK